MELGVHGGPVGESACGCCSCKVAEVRSWGRVSASAESGGGVVVVPAAVGAPKLGECGSGTSE